MRVLLLTGESGVGTTTAAGAAVHASSPDLSTRVLSAEPAS